MKELFINCAKTCSVTGHRVLDKSFDKEILKAVFINLINDGYDTFLIGMALGFDTECFKILTELKNQYYIKLISCIPCPTQDYKFTKNQKEEYEEMLSVADEKIIISESYTKKCMQKRNEYMVNNSSVIVAYLRRDFGGTFNTIRYAQKKNIKVIKV